jgi:hypothetical protein
MNTRMVIDDKNGLKEIRKPEFPLMRLGTRLVARFISWIFHPVFLPLYTVFFMVYIHPYLFAGFSGWEKTRIMAMSGLMYTFFPLITVLLLKGLNFIDSIFLRTQKDRVIPIITSMIWYFWIWNVWRNFNKVKDAGEMPPEVIQFALAAFISTIISLMLNIKLKISLHAIGAGVMLGFVLLLALSQGLNFGIYLSIAIFITGLICTSRFIASDHTQVEVYGGLAAGLMSMLIASWF